MSGAVIPILYAVADVPAAVLSSADVTAEGSPAGGEASTPPPDSSPLTPQDTALLESPTNPNDAEENSDLWMYRDRTVLLLKRYARLAVETGRLPSLLGREFFRAKITSYHAATFEDTVIFVHDVETSLEKLGRWEKKLIAMVVIEEFSQEEAARLLHCSPRTVGRCIYETLDRLSEIFLRGSILEPLPTSFPNRETPCQGGKSSQLPVSDSKETNNNFQNLSDLPH